jgi:hypothetical protein
MMIGLFYVILLVAILRLLFRTPTEANKGKMFVVKKTSASHQVTINAGDGSVLIDDATSHSDNAKNGYDQVVSDGTQYWIITHGH